MRKMVVGFLVFYFLCYPQVGFCGKKTQRYSVPDVWATVTLLRKNFIEGIPVNFGGELRRVLVPALSAVLESPMLVQYHKYAVTALGVIGDKAAYSALFRYIDNIPDKITLDHFEALLNVPLALGHLAANGDSRALKYLLDHSYFDKWGNVARVSIDGFQFRELYMVRAVLNGLGVSGNDMALKRLEELRDGDKLIQECVNDNISINRRIANHLMSTLLVSLSGKERCLSTLLRENKSRSVGGLEGTLGHSIIFQDMSIERHPEVQLRPGKIENPLEEASFLLQTANGPEDVACPISMQLKEPVGVYGKVGDGDAAIQCESQLLRVLCMPDYRVKLVVSISGLNLCDTRGEGTFAGCAEEPGGNIIMKPSDYGDIWAHEFGHNQGLGHRNSVQAIMSPDSMSTFEVNELECKYFRIGGHGL